MGFMDPVPDGGWACLMFICAFLNVFIITGFALTYGILFPYLLVLFNESEVRTAFVGTLSTGMSLFFIIPIVKFKNIYGPTLTSLLGSIIYGAGVLATSYSNDMAWFYLFLSIFGGVGRCMIVNAAMSIVGMSFVKHKSVVMKLMTCSGMLGGTCLSMVFKHFMDHRGVMLFLRGFGVVYLILGMLFSLSYGRLEENVRPDHLHMSLSLPLLKCKKFRLFLFIMVLSSFNYCVPLVYMVNYTLKLGFEPHRAASLIGIYCFFSLVGRLFFSRLVGRFRDSILEIYTGCMFLGGMISIFCYFLHEYLSYAYWTFVAYTVVFAFLDGSFMGCMSDVMLYMFGADNFPHGNAILLTLVGFPLTTGPLTVAFLNDTQAVSKPFMFIMCGAPFVIGSLLMTVLMQWINESHTVQVVPKTN